METIFDLLLVNKNKKILFVGIGNRLKRDDAIGIYICEKLNNNNNINTLIVETGIEKYVGKINSMNPDILVLVDCTSFNRNPGFFNLLPISEVLDYTTHTHTISLKKISHFFAMKTYILGIQPENVSFGEGFTPGVKNSADSIISFLNRNLF